MNEGREAPFHVPEKKTDRELLELAAKAAGVVIGRYDSESIGFSAGFNFPSTNVWWNPLASDADAFRLAMQLDMRLDDIQRGEMAGCVVAICNGVAAYEAKGTDKCAAMRRAIVCAAAA